MAARTASDAPSPFMSFRKSSSTLKADAVLLQDIAIN